MVALTAGSRLMAGVRPKVLMVESTSKVGPRLKVLLVGLKLMVGVRPKVLMVDSRRMAAS